MPKNLNPETYLSDPSKFTMVDVRSDEEWDAYHDESAIHIPLTDIESSISKIPKGKPLAVICRTGGRSARGCELLDPLGFDTYNLLGGIRMLVMARAKLGQITSVHAHAILARL